MNKKNWEKGLFGIARLGFIPSTQERVAVKVF